MQTPEKVAQVCLTGASQNNIQELKVTCQSCGKLYKKKSLSKHMIINHATPEKKMEHFKGNYCIDCDYGDVQNDKFKKHLNTKKHKEKLLIKCRTIKNNSIESLFEYLLNKFKEILIEYRYFESINICKLTNNDKQNIVITKKSIENKLASLKMKLATEDITLEILEKRVIQTTIEKELLQDYHIKINNIKDQKIQNALIVTLFSEDIDHLIKKNEIDQKISFYKDKIMVLAPTLNILQEFKPFNFKLHDQEVNWLQLSNHNIKLYKMPNQRSNSYKYINGQMYYNFINNELSCNAFDYCNIVCIYDLVISNSTFHILRKYKGKTINIMKNKLVNFNDEILDLINLNSNSFELRLHSCFYSPNNCPKIILREFTQNYNKEISNEENISKFFETNIDTVKEFLNLNVDEVQEYKIYNNNNILESLGVSKRGAPVEYKTAEEKETKHKLQKINYIRKKANLPTYNTIEQIEKKIKKKLEDDTINMINNSTDLSPSSKKVYINKLSRLHNIGVDIYNFNENEMEKILKEYDPPRSQQMYLLAMHAFMKRNGKGVPVYLQNQINKVQKEINVINSKNELSERQKETFTNWETVIQVRDKLEQNYKKYKSKENMMHYLYLSLYTYLPPRRLEDYRDMFLDNAHDLGCSENDILIYNKYKEESNESYKYSMNKLECEKTTKNYIIMKENACYFIFNAYKTKKTYGKQVIEVPNILKEIIKEYISICRLENGDKLFDYSASFMSELMQKIFRKYINKGTSVSDLRHIYINKHIDKKMSGENKQNISSLMGHSKAMQSQYDTIEDIPSDKVIDNKEQ